MTGQSFTGETLVDALESGALARKGISLVGMVKAGEAGDRIAFTTTDCDSWVQLPTSFIDAAVHLGESSCDDHSHPIFKVTLKEPADPEAKLLASLLTAPGRARRLSPVQPWPQSPGPWAAPSGPWRGPQPRPLSRPFGSPGQRISHRQSSGGPIAARCWKGCDYIWNGCAEGGGNLAFCQEAYDACMLVCDAIGWVETVFGWY